MTPTNTTAINAPGIDRDPTGDEVRRFNRDGHRVDLPYVIYCRVSRKGNREGDRFISPALQERRAREAAAAHGLAVWPHVIYDQNVSGGTMDRPGMNEAINLIRTGKVAGIVVMRFDRFARMKLDGPITLQTIEGLDGELLSADEGWQSLKGDGFILVVMRAWAAEKEREKRTADLSRSVDRAIQEGRHLSDAFGYVKGADRKLTREQKRGEAKAVHRMFERRAQGWSWRRIADECDEVGPAPRSYRRNGVRIQGTWRGQAIAGIVGSDLYLGVAHNGDRRMPNAHPAIVSESLWAQANAVKGTKFADRVEDAPNPDGFTLSRGLVRCASCGYAMTGAVERGRLYYRCRGRQHGQGKCDNPTCVNGDQLHDFVWSEFDRRYAVDSEPDEGARSTDVLAAQDAVATATAQYESAVTERIEQRAKGASENMLAILDRTVDTATAAMVEAESLLLSARLREARPSALQHVDITGDLLRTLPVDEQQAIISAAFVVVVRSANFWREPVADRSYTLTRDEVPSGRHDLIRAVARRTSANAN